MGKLNIITMVMLAAISSSQTAFAATVNPLAGGYDPTTSTKVEERDSNFSVDKWKEYQTELDTVKSITDENEPLKEEIRQLSIKQWASQTTYEEREKIKQQLAQLRPKYSANQTAIQEAQNKANSIEQNWKILLKGDNNKLETFKTNMATLVSDSADAAAKKEAEEKISTLFPKPDYIGEPNKSDDGKLRQFKNVAAGFDDTDAVNVAQLKRAESHYISINAEDQSEGSNYANDGAINLDASAGYSKNAMAIGVKAKSRSASSIAIGTESKAGTECVKADNCGGNDSSSIAIGHKAQSLNNGTISIGDQSKAIQNYSIAIGDKATSYVTSIAIGPNAEALSQALSSIAMGDSAKVDTGATQAIALGYKAYVAKDAYNAMALGANSVANIADGVAVGFNSKTNVGSGVFGYHPQNKTLKDVLSENYEDTLKSLKEEGQKLVDNERELAAKKTQLANPDVSDKTNLEKEVKELEDKISANKKQITEYQKSLGATTAWKSTAAGFSVGDAERGITRQINNVAAGTLDTDAVNVAQLKSAQTHYFSVNSSTSDENSNYFNDGAKGTDAMAIGPMAKAQGYQAFALGKDAQAIAETAGDSNMMAIGWESKATKTDALAIGTKTVADHINATAIGTWAQAHGDYSFAGGADSYAFGERSIAIGVHINEAELGKLVTHNAQTNTNTVNENGFKDFIKYKDTLTNLVANETTRNELLTDINKLNELVADEAKLKAAVPDEKKRTDLVNYQKQITELRATLVKDGLQARLGSFNQYGATGGQAIAIGNEALASGSYAVSVGTQAQATNLGTSAYGYQAEASGEQATAIGFASGATGDFSTAVGTAAKSSGYTSVALGYGAKSRSTESIAIGRGANVGIDGDNAPIQGSIAIGRDSSSQAGLSIAIGADAKNFTGEDRPQGPYTGATAVGVGATTGKEGKKGTLGVGSTAIGNQSRANTEEMDGGVQNYATAVGTSSNAQGTYASALGTHSQAWGHYSVAIGMQSNGNGRQNGAYGYGSNAIGLYSYARGLYSNALGSESQAIYNDSVALGRATLANAVNSTALGSYAETHGMNSVALGYKAQTTLDSSVALGENSITDGAAFTAGYEPIKSSVQDMKEIVGAGKLAEYNAKKNEILEIDEKLYSVNEILKEAEYTRIHGKTEDERKAANTVTSDNRKKRDELLTQKAAAVKYIKDNFGGSSTWESTAAGVSVGNSDLGITRQINNVAAGTLDTDAVNVAQLKLLAGAPVTVYNGGNVANNQYSLGTQIDNGNVHINNLRFAFTDGLKAELQKDKDQNNVVVVSLSGGGNGNNGNNGNNGTAGKDGKDGKDGRDGRDGKDGTVLTPESVVTVKEVHTGKTVVNNKGVVINKEGDKNEVSITENGLDNGGNRAVNIADGQAPTDAVNRRQLDQVENRVVERMESRLRKERRRADAGTASAIAQGAIPQVTIPGARGLGVGGGHYGNQSAVSIGGSAMSDNGKWIFKSNVSANSQGKFGVGAGVLYQWR